MANHRGASADRAGDVLRRDIGFFGSSAIVFNGVVGAGIFGLPAILAADFGGFSPWLFPIFGVLIFCIAVPFAGLAKRFDVTGGPVAYVEEAFGTGPAFQVGWIYYIARVSAFAANAHVPVLYAATIFPILADPLVNAVAVGAFCVFLTWLNVVGVRQAVGALSLMGVLKAAPIIVGGLAGLILYADAVPAPEPLPPLSGMEAAALAVLYAFIGFEGASVTAGETRDPKRTIGRSYLVTLAATALIYFVIQMSYMAVMGDAAGAPGGDGHGGVDGAPLASFGTVLAGGAGGLIFVLAAVFSITGNLAASMLSAPRLPFALAQRRALPGFFAHVSARFGTPSYAIIFTGVLALFLTVFDNFIALAVMSTLARLLVYLLSCASLPAIMRRRGEAADAGFWRRTASAALGVAVSLFLIAQTQWASWATLGVLIAIGLALFAGQSVWRRARNR